jgi:hypothetical protein
MASARWSKPPAQPDTIHGLKDYFFIRNLPAGGCFTEAAIHGAASGIGNEPGHQVWAKSPEQDDRSNEIGCPRPFPNPHPASFSEEGDYSTAEQERQGKHSAGHQGDHDAQSLTLVVSWKEGRNRFLSRGKAKEAIYSLVIQKEPFTALSKTKGGVLQANLSNLATRTASNSLWYASLICRSNSGRRSFELLMPKSST